MLGVFSYWTIIIYMLYKLHFHTCSLLYPCIFTYCTCASIAVWRQAGDVWEFQVSAAAGHGAAAASPRLREPGCHREGVPGPLQPAAGGCAVRGLCQLLPEENRHGPGWLWEECVGLLKGNRVTALQEFPLDWGSQDVVPPAHLAGEVLGTKSCRLWG